MTSMLVLEASYSMQYGPCHDVTTVDVDYKEWEAAGGLYVNVQPVEHAEHHCEWLFHYLTHDDDGTIYLSHYFKHIKNNTQEATTWCGKHVGRGHYVAKSHLIDDRISIINTYILYFDPPNLICHFTCTDDPYFKHVKGGLFCVSAAPDAPHVNAPVIRQVAENNGFDLNDLMIVDNCKTTEQCSNYIPFELGANSKCHNTTIKEYFEL